jgi:hypothetical protein
MVICSRPARRLQCDASYVSLVCLVNVHRKIIDMKHVLYFLMAALSLVACSGKPSPTIFLSFTESSPDGDFPVRMLVNEKYLRIEDGDAHDGFIVFDRAARTIYSVSHTGKSTLVIHARPVTLSAPKQFEHKVERGKEALPSVDGKTVTHYRLLTNRERCFDVYAAEGLLPEAVTALREYHETLAGEQAKMQTNMPPAMQSACDLADQVLLPARYLAYGFPVRQVNRAGVTRQLVSYKRDVPVEKGIFDLPKDYKEITTSKLR